MNNDKRVITLFSFVGDLYPYDICCFSLHLSCFPASLTLSSLTLSILMAGSDVGLCGPTPVMPFGSIETFSLPLRVSVGVNTCDE